MIIDTKIKANESHVNDYQAKTRLNLRISRIVCLIKQKTMTMEQLQIQEGSKEWDFGTLQGQES